MRQVDTIVLVRDILRTKEFYQGVFGLEILHDWGAMIVFRNRLAFHQADKLHPQERMAAEIPSGSLGCGNLVIYIETPDLDATRALLKGRGVPFVHDILSPPWGGHILRVKDPDGHLVELGGPSQSGSPRPWRGARRLAPADVQRAARGALAIAPLQGARSGQHDRSPHWRAKVPSSQSWPNHGLPAHDRP